ncbi:hypothetical protein C5167_015602 [Papaver somniferum]|uniref:BED-type domain-containing protein n=2 Tax=Papaver somniferum TaxID=3469 RepID=A0A4Y7J9M5_PAPSO|nr:hypothetical protein C5167_015602 [Papaver somniferum]
MRMFTVWELKRKVWQKEIDFKGMATNEVTVSVLLDHGALVNKTYGRVRLRCNYCGKEVSGYSRLKQHLGGGMRGEVTPCFKVPEDVKVQMESRLPRTKKAHVNNSRQGKNEAVVDFHHHGTLVDGVKRRVRCNYCGEEINSYSLFLYHLVGIDEYVVACNKVPEDVRVHMRNKLLPDTRKQHEHREVLQWSDSSSSLMKDSSSDDYSPDESSSSWTRDSSSDDSSPDEASVDVRYHATVLDTKKGRVRCNYCAKEMNNYTRFRQHLGGIRGHVSPCVEVPEVIKVQMRKYSLRALSRKRKHSIVVEYSGSDQVDEKLQVLHNPETVNEEEAEDDSPRQTQRCVGRFFFANGIDFSAANSSTFEKMIHALVGGGSTAYKVPSCDDLNGWILEGELKAMREHVQEVVCSWGSTGCSILLDGWTDDKGRNMINFVVDSPQGPIFMKSADFSDSIGDVDAMISLFSGVIEEIGVQNVVQIVTYTTGVSMEAVGKQMTEKYKSIFWTVCASHCIGLMLEKIGMLGTERGVLGKAKTITKFIYSHETVLKLMKEHTLGFDLVSSSRIRSMMPFLILETIEFQKNNLRKMFISPEWKNLTLASTADGRMVADLVTGESSFWAEVEMLLKASTPLIRALHLLNGEDSRPQLGYIYRTMGRVKETIKKMYEGRKAEFQPFWTVIDGIWDDQLHSPIHAAGYYLNPGLFYFKDFYADNEVKAGLLCCIVRIVEDEREQDLIVLQFDEYRKASGAFGDGDAVDQRAKIAPAKWWSLYGGECPELQRFAIRILSQTCTGAVRYGLKRSLTEELHIKKGRNCLEQKRLTELTFVHHNLQLQNLPASNSDYTDIFLEPIDPMDEWIGGSGMVEKAAKQNGNV